MESKKENVQRLIDQNLNTEKQAWLLGAGISKEAGIPLMTTLTSKVKKDLTEASYEQGDTDLGVLFESIEKSLNDDSNIEDILSHIGDFITIGKRNKSKNVTISSNNYDVDDLQELHRKIHSAISRIVRNGYSKSEGEDAKGSTIRIEDHLEFIKAIYGKRFSGKIVRTPIKFFTTNYDTLLEDALSLYGIKSADGFWGGSVGFWDIEHFEKVSNEVSAKIFKLHGSIDWYNTDSEQLIRKREGTNYPDEETSQLLIYPQATKYKLTQRDPFAQLFEKFRRTLTSGELKLLGICGYSFSDEHINEEIEKAMLQVDGSTTILALVEEKEDGLPSVLESWLSPDCTWKENLLVGTNKGFYHGSTENLLKDENKDYDWWTFQGLSKVLSQGAEVAI